jgi:hypothetical protein
VNWRTAFLLRLGQSSPDLDHITNDALAQRPDDRGVFGKRNIARANGWKTGLLAVAAVSKPRTGDRGSQAARSSPSRAKSARCKFLQLGEL